MSAPENTLLVINFSNFQFSPLRPFPTLPSPLSPGFTYSMMRFTAGIVQVKN
jgi:hypothetical protein